MFTESDLRELVEYSGKGPVLSVYLDTEPSLGNADAYKLRLRNMIKDILLPHDVEAIERYFNQEHNWQGRGVALFSCAGDGFFRSYPLALPVRDLYHIGDRPSVKQLATMLENYGGYGVVLVDRQGARLFFFHMGEMVEQEGVLGEVVKHTKLGGASSLFGRRGGVAGTTRHEEETVTRNMKDSVESATHFFDQKHVRRVLIGGTDDNVALFRSLLPKAWQSLIVGSFAMAMTAGHNEVLVRTLQVGGEAERERESGLKDKLISTAARGGDAVVGLDKVLDAVNQGKVQTLVMVENLHKPGFSCKSCGALSLTSGDACSVCGEKVNRIPDVVELTVGSTLRKDGDIEVVMGDEQMEKIGGIGAMLRY